MVNSWMLGVLRIVLLSYIADDSTGPTISNLSCSYRTEPIAA
jgi:hypothetical protein